jgi:threonine synthase
MKMDDLDNLAQSADTSEDPSAVLCENCGIWFQARCPDCKPETNEAKLKTSTFDYQRALADRDAETDDLNRKIEHLEGIIQGIREQWHSYNLTNLPETEARVEATRKLLNRAPK